MQQAAFATTSSSLAAVFLDYENLYFHLKTAYHEPPSVNDIVLEILRNMRKKLSNEMNLDPIVFKGYADFERLHTPPLGSLYLMGIDTVNVLGTHHKNAADMRLCIDLMEVLYTRPDIQHYVLVAGDRDYIPIVQHLRRQGRKVTAVSFREALSGDLLEILGQNNVEEALDILSDDTRTSLQQHREAAVARQKAEKAHLPSITTVGKIDLNEMGGRSRTPYSGTARTSYTQRPVQNRELRNTYQNTKKDNLQICVQELVFFMREKNVQEIWLSPFLRSLTDALPMLADYERKGLIEELEKNGAVRIEKRAGDPYDYSVIIVNLEHTMVEAAMQEVQN